ncbi:hypothetical protein AX16_005434 [Volvariella volvacea WC 439]|nr:hypothetical protein AX16_005434 [Volvariella volvacea WC 439]
MDSQNTISHKNSAKPEAPLPFIPLEIWSEVFALACWDGGYTGGSLASVSRSFNVLSATYRYQSIAICGKEQLFSLLSLLESLPPEKRHIRGLFFSEFPLSDKQLPAEQQKQPRTTAARLHREAFDFQHGYFRLLQLAAPTLHILHEYRRFIGVIEADGRTSIRWCTRNLHQLPVLKEYTVADIQSFELPSQDKQQNFFFDSYTTRKFYNAASDDESDSDSDSDSIDSMDDCAYSTRSLSPVNGVELDDSPEVDPGYLSDPGPDIIPRVQQPRLSVQFNTMSNRSDAIPSDTPEGSTSPPQIEGLRIFISDLTREQELKLWRETSCFPSLECLHITQSAVYPRLMLTLPQAIKHLRVNIPPFYLDPFIRFIEKGREESDPLTGLLHQPESDGLRSVFLSPWNWERKIYVSHPNPRDSGYSSHLQYMRRKASDLTWFKVLGPEFEVQETGIPSVQWSKNSVPKMWQDGARKALSQWLDRLNGSIWWTEE